MVSPAWQAFGGKGGGGGGLHVEVRSKGGVPFLPLRFFNFPLHSPPL